MCLIAVSWLTLDPWLAVLEVAVGLGFVIFVHELGHFAVAKLCGVKVEKFYLGFDIGGLRLGRFRRGETEYGIGILPLGGYVKMLGQEDNPARLREEIERAKENAGQSPAKAPGLRPGDLAPDAGGADLAGAERTLFDPRSYLAQSVPRRMAIISAGVIMNMIFAFVLAVIAFGLGVVQTAASVGEVAPGGGAWKAGVQSGDEITAVDGEGIQTFNELTEAIVLSGGDSVAMVVQRPGPGKPREEDFNVPTRLSGGRPNVGIAPAGEPILAKHGETLPFRPGTPAAEAQPPFRRGDRLVRLDAEPIDRYSQILQYLALHPDRPVDVTARRADSNKGGETPQGEEVKMRVAPHPVKQFGLLMEMGEITAIQADSPALAAGLQPGDVLQTLDGRPVADPMRLPDWFRTRARQTVTLGVSGKDRQGTVPIKVTLREPDQPSPPISPGSPVALPELGAAYKVLNTIREVQPGSPAAEAGLRAGDVIESATIHPPSGEAFEQFDQKYGPSDLSDLYGRDETFPFGHEKPNWPCFFHAVQATLPGTTVDLEWSHNGEKTNKVIEPGAAADWFNPDRGWHFEVKSIVQKASSTGQALKLAKSATIRATLAVYRMLNSVGSGRVSARNFGGPWTIIKVALYEAMRGPGNLLLFLTLLSANLAVLNFLPIPLLDGGHFVFLLYEGIRGKPADERVQEILTYIGLAFILGLMIFVLGLDFGLIPRPGR
ncbi:MAG: site-2 protease family protein [Thermoguttaceae bacterium]